MQLINMFFDDIEDAKKRRVPFIIPIGTIEYHAHHLSCGTDTMVINGVLRELEKEKEIVVCPPIWYGVASYAVGGPETGTIQVDEDSYTNYLYCILKSMIYGGVRNIYCIAHHQTEGDGLMPMTIA
jgi:creatinine amidohydrolase